MCLPVCAVQVRELETLLLTLLSNNVWLQSRYCLCLFTSLCEWVTKKKMVIVVTMLVWFINLMFSTWTVCHCSALYVALPHSLVHIWHSKMDKTVWCSYMCRQVGTAIVFWIPEGVLGFRSCVSFFHIRNRLKPLPITLPTYSKSESTLKLTKF